jgi:hypothetical protein
MFDLMSHVNRDDGEARMNAFIQAFITELNSDEIAWDKKGYQIAKAIQNNDVEGLFIALCGWSPRSIATKAMLVRDTEQEFHDDDFIDSEIIVEWSNGDTTEGECAVNPATHEVRDFNPAIMRHEWATIKTVGVAVGMDSELFECVPASAATEDPDAFWYADPCVPVSGDIESANEQDNKWSAKHISEIQNGDIVRYGEELYLATSDAYLTATNIGKEWNFSVVGGTEDYLYATSFEGAMVDVLRPGKIECSFTANSDWTPIQNSKFAPAVDDFASMIYAANGNYVELAIVEYCGRLTFYCEHSAVNEEYADEMVTCKFSLSQMTPETLREKMAAICHRLCEGKTLSNCID